MLAFVCFSFARISRDFSVYSRDSRDIRLRWQSSASFQWHIVSMYRGKWHCRPAVSKGYVTIKQRIRIVRSRNCSLYATNYITFLHANIRLVRVLMDSSVKLNGCVATPRRASGFLIDSMTATGLMPECCRTSPYTVMVLLLPLTVEPDLYGTTI